MGNKPAWNHCLWREKLPLQEQCIHTHANDCACHPQFFKTRHFLQALPSYSCWPAIIYICIYIYVYTYIIFLLRKSGWNSFWTLAHVRKKAHVLVRAFTGLHYTHKEAQSHHGWLLRQQDRRRASVQMKQRMPMCIFSFPACFATCAHNKITLQFFGTFSCSFKQEGEAAAAETRQTQKLKKERRKESQQHTKAATQPHPVWTVSRPDPKVQHLSTERCRTALQLFTPVMPTISLYSFLRDRPQTYSLKKRAQQVPTKRLTKGLCDNAAMPAEIADWIAHHSRSHVLGARAIRDFTKTWAVMAPQNGSPLWKTQAAKAFSRQRAVQEKRAGEEADKLSRGTGESESSFESSKMKLWECRCTRQSKGTSCP